MNDSSEIVSRILSSYRTEVNEEGADAESFAPPFSVPGAVFEVTCNLVADQKGAERVREAWNEIGDLVGVSGGPQVWSCHIHTDRPGLAIEIAVALGKPFEIRIVDLRVDSAAEDDGLFDFEPIEEVASAPLGIVGVASGPGLVDLFRSLGAQGVIGGIHRFSPSIDELLAKVEAVVAETVIVLPNNKNLVPVAEQLDSLTTKTVIVVPTRSLVQGLAAMYGYVPGSTDASSVADDMGAAASSVVDGELVRATRDAVVDGDIISRGEWLGMADGTIVVNDSDIESALRGLVAAILPPGAENLTLYRGEDSSPSTTKALVAWLGELYPELGVTVIEGGQPEYPYLVAIE